MSSSVIVAKHSLNMEEVHFKVEDTTSLRAFRAIAEKEGIMTPRDLFTFGKSRINVPKAREGQLVWADIQDPEDKAVHINVTGVDFSAKDGLTTYEKQVLLQRSRIGFGFNATDEQGPKYTNRQVVADVPFTRIACLYANEAKRDIIVTPSSRDSAYFRAGWADAKLAAQTPWVNVGVQAPSLQSSANSESQRRVYVTGRYVFARGTITMKDYVSQLQPHPEFRQAIMSALAITNDRERTQEVKRVLNWYGTMFVTSVEVGGMKHVTVEKVLDGRTTESSIRAEMNAALGKRFGPPDFEAGETGQKNEFESMHFHTVGGDIEAPCISEWIGSLYLPLKWGITRVLGVESVLSLFDKDTQTKIALAFFKTPIYQFRNIGGRHCLSTDTDPSKLLPSPDGAWSNLGPIGIVLKAPLDGAVPGYHFSNGTRHVFGYDLAERDGHIRDRGYRDMGVPCYVYLTQKPGTVLLSRTWNANFPDNAYATTREDIENQRSRGYVADGYYRCYVYPA